MKKSNFVAMILGTISGVFFALGMCMAMISEWNTFKPEIVFGCVGILLGLVTLIVWRKMEHKEPIHFRGKPYLPPLSALSAPLLSASECASAWSGAKCS